jgi:hypothetical protein
MKPQLDRQARGNRKRPLPPSLLLILFGNIGVHLVKTGKRSIDVVGLKIPTQIAVFLADSLIATAVLMGNPICHEGVSKRCT